MPKISLNSVASISQLEPKSMPHPQVHISGSRFSKPRASRATSQTESIANSAGVYPASRAIQPARQAVVPQMFSSGTSFRSSTSQPP